jgi:hypothetical protein
MGMFGAVSKGTILEKTDQLANNLGSRMHFHTLLTDPSLNYVDILDEAHRSQYWSAYPSVMLLDRRESRYLRTKWFPDVPDLPPQNPTDLDLTKYLAAFEGSWWQDRQPIVHVIRQGLIKALEEAGYDAAQKPNSAWLPIDSYWICAGDSFEVIVTRSDVQVTRLLLTPSVPVHLPYRHSSLRNMWVIKTDIIDRTHVAGSPTYSRTRVVTEQVGVETP